MSSGHNNYTFLSDGGEMGELIRNYNWKNSPLGEPGTWPQSLKTALRLMLSSGHPMFIWWGPQLIQFYNDAYRRSIGPERHPTAVGQPGRECWEEIWEIIGPQIEQVMSGRGATWNENRLVPITRNGKREDVYWTYSYNPIDDPDSPNGIGGVLVICAETTAQVFSEQRLHAAQARWRELFNQAPGFMCILNGPDHRFEFANPRYFDLIGTSDIIGKTVAEVLPETETQGFIDLLDDVYNTGKAFTGVAVPLLLSSSRHKHVYLDFVYQPIRHSDGRVTGIFVDGYDVTDRVLSIETLRDEDRKKDEFLAMLAHELRNPLAPIRNAGEVLTQLSTADTTVRTIGDLILRQVTQLTHLVDDLLDISRITQGQIELQQQPLDLDQMIRLALESAQPVIGEKNHTVIYETGPDAIIVNGDATRIIQCLTNIITNAAKYTDPNGRIRIELTKTDNMALIDVTDNGMGITAKLLPRIFDLFIQAGRPLDRSQGGLGIGLSIVQRLVQMHGGTVTAHSKGLGQGASFQIRLPLLETPLIQTRENFNEKPTMKRLLIVDDNVDAADTLAQLLQLNGHDTKAVYNAQNALQTLKSFEADIILLDIGLPDIDGYEVARQIRSFNKHSMLIALTGYGKADDIQRSKEAGFTAHITKPIIFSELERILKEH